MATYVLGALIAICFLLALKHVVNNMRTGKHDCCGCNGCDAGTSKNKKSAESETGSCSCCGGK